MPTGNLPASGKNLWEEVYNKALKGSCKGDKGCAAQTAWSAVKGAGWKKDKDGNWSKKSEVAEFSMTITRASYDKASNEMRWKASASDIDDDLYGDNMTLELFADFIDRIKSNEAAPVDFRSSFWSGGMPYLSVSHYPDLDGKAVPGTIEAVYVDGNFLKSEGKFSDNPLGRSAFRAVNDDLYGKNKDGNGKVRISIAFIDWKHQHKDSNYIFERKSLDDICPECVQNVLEAWANEGNEDNHYSPKLQGPKKFLRGQLIHEAMTRVPVNERTLMEVERSMTTRKEDAASIIGEDLANEIEEQAKLVGKSQALVIKAEEGDMSDCAEGESEEDCRKRLETNAVTEAEPGMELIPQKSEAEVEKYVDPEADGMVWKPYGGATSMKDAQAVIEARKEQYRIEDMWWMFQDVINNIMSSGEVEDKGKAIASAANEFKTLLGSESSKAMTVLLSRLIEDREVKPVPAHPLDVSFTMIRSKYDDMLSSGVGEEEFLQTIQGPYSELGEAIKAAVKPKDVTPHVEDNPLVQQVSQLSQAVNLILTKLDALPATSRPVQQVPVRRSIDARLVKDKGEVAQKSTTPTLRAIINRTTN